MKLYALTASWMDARCGEYRPYVCKRRMGELKNVMLYYPEQYPAYGVYF